MMKALAAVAIILMISAPTFADESVASEVTRQAIELSDAQMDGVVAGYWDAGVVILDITDTRTTSDTGQLVIWDDVSIR